MEEKAYLFDHCLLFSLKQCSASKTRPPFLLSFPLSLTQFTLLTLRWFNSAGWTRGSTCPPCQMALPKRSRSRLPLQHLRILFSGRRKVRPGSNAIIA